MSRVLVTGGSGFIGSHAVASLLKAGHEVRTTVRGADREEKVHALLHTAGANSDGRLSFAVADLEKDDGWSDAVEGCENVLNVASPFPASIPRHEDDLVVPAREGALRVLRAARDAGVKRVVLTSSFAAIGYGHAPRDEPFDETSWTNINGRDVSAYAKSKTLAERAAWDFIESGGGGLDGGCHEGTLRVGECQGMGIRRSALEWANTCLSCHRVFIVEQRETPEPL